MTPEENKRRSLDPNVNYIKSNICDCDGDKSYVFISYKSDDWEVVLHDIVYRLVKDYGLNVYFDGSFDSHNSLWINQFPENMSNYKCKGVIAFFDDKYTTSYATLMELLYSQTKKAAMGKKNPNGLPIVPIDLEKLTNITGRAGEKNTGLGVDVYEDGSLNVNAGSELALFTKSFKELVKREVLVDAEFIWEAGETLNAMTCSQIVREIKAYKKVNENYYTPGMSLDGIVGSIRNAFGDDVFSEVKPSTGDDNPKDEPIVAPTGDQSDEPTDGPIVGPDEPKESGYRYTIFGKEYTAEDRDQGKLMLDAFETLVARFPGCEESLTQRGSVAKAEDVTNPNTQNANPKYFRGAKEATVNGQKYLVGTSYGFDAKLVEIRKMFEICGADVSEFVLNGKALSAGKKSKPNSGGTTGGKEKEDAGAFEYNLWGISHTAKTLVDLMHDVFDLVAERYASLIPQIADDLEITFVARKVDVDEMKLPQNKLNYFMSKREHKVDGVIYYVSARYNREQGIEQLEKMLKACEGNSAAFQITAVPKKIKKNANGKKGIGEIIDTAGRNEE